MARVFHYDPQRIRINLGGVDLTASGGFADGTFLTVEFPGDAWTTKVSADGQVYRSRNHAGTAYAVITMTVMAHSPINATLAAAAAADIGTQGLGLPSGAGLIPTIIIRNEDATLDLLSATNCYVAKLPTKEYGTEIGTREWVLHCPLDSISVAALTFGADL
jgi:hypothetical protein